MQHSDNFPHGSWCECTWMPASVAELEETTTNPEHQSAKNYKELLKIENLTKGHAWLRWRSCIQIAWFNKFSYRTKSWDFQYEKKKVPTYEKNKDGGAPLDLPWWDWCLLYPWDGQSEHVGVDQSQYPDTVVLPLPALHKSHKSFSSVLDPQWWWRSRSILHCVVILWDIQPTTLKVLLAENLILWCKERCTH